MDLQWFLSYFAGGGAGPGTGFAVCCGFQVELVVMAGGTPGGAAGAGTANTGGGGGGGGSSKVPGANGGAGGSGIVIIRYRFQ